MDAIALLKQDHERVRGLLHDVQAAAGRVRQRQAIVDTLFDELQLHTRLEEEVFYPTVGMTAGEVGTNLARSAIHAHSIMKSLMDELRILAPDGAEYDEKFKALMLEVGHHVAEEEGELFPYAEEALGTIELEELGRRMEARKETLVAHEPTLLGETIQRAKTLVTKALDALTGKSLPKRRRRQRAADRGSRGRPEVHGPAKQRTHQSARMKPRHQAATTVTGHARPSSSRTEPHGVRAARSDTMARQNPTTKRRDQMPTAAHARKGGVRHGRQRRS